MQWITTNAPGIGMISVAGGIYGWLMYHDAEFAVMTTIAALCGALMSVGLFGHRGRRGWGFAALGGLVATALGAGLMGGFLQYPGGILVGPAAVLRFAGSDLSAPLVWIAMMAGAHLLMRQRRGLLT